METLVIILGIALIFVAAYAADRNERVKTFKSLYYAEGLERDHFENLSESLLESTEKLLGDIERLEAFAPPAREPFEKRPWTWSEQDNMLKALTAKLDYQETKYEEMRKVYYDVSALHVMPDPVLKNTGQKPAEVIKIELGDDFKELKASDDSLGSVAILKTELDRAHKREAVYMKRLLVSNAAILAASKKS
jgi:hypothetical protein